MNITYNNITIDIYGKHILDLIENQAHTKKDVIKN